jgi:DNA-binding transcriptional regulator GbsR (MarR family)
MTATNPSALNNQFVVFMGQLAELCSFNRSIGQIYGTLFISAEPLCLEDIAKSCRMSKGSASIHLRTLESWGAVHQTWKPGTRKDYYHAEMDVIGLASRRLDEGVRKRMTFLRSRIDEMKKECANLKDDSDGRSWVKRLAEFDTLVSRAEKGLPVLLKLSRLQRLF